MIDTLDTTIAHSVQINILHTAVAHSVLFDLYMGSYCNILCFVLLIMLDIYWYIRKRCSAPCSVWFTRWTLLQRALFFSVETLDSTIVVPFLRLIYMIGTTSALFSLLDWYNWYYFNAIFSVNAIHKCSTLFFHKDRLMCYYCGRLSFKID